MTDQQPGIPLRMLPLGRVPPLVAVLVAVTLGILAARYWPVPLRFPLVAACILFLLWAWFWWQRRYGWSSWLLLGCTAALAAAWYFVYWNTYPVDQLGLAATGVAQPVVVEVTALESARKIPAPPADSYRSFARGDRSRLSVRVNAVRDAGCWRPASGNAVLTVEGHLLGIQCGDRLRVYGTFDRPPGPANPGGFDFAAFNRQRRRLVELRATHPDAVTRRSRGSPYDLRRLRSIVRDRCHERLWGYLERRQAEMAAAILLGEREQLGWQRTEAFFTTGTIHLLAISGLHVGILAVGFWWLARLLALPRRRAVLTVAACVVLYALLTEARPPVIRAALLVVAFCLARLSARRINGYNTLAGAALLLLIWNPTNLFQIGPQLSFLAVATMIYFAPWLARSRQQDPLRRLVASTRPWWAHTVVQAASAFGRLVAVTTLIWLVALPLAMVRFHLVSPIALLLNPLVWLPIGLALFAGFGVLTLGWLVPPAAEVCGYVCDRSLALLEAVVTWAGGIQAGHFWTPGPAAWWVLGTYLGLACHAAFLRRRLPRRWSLAVAAGWLAMGICLGGVFRPSLARFDQQQLTCSVLSVGHGSCAVIQLPGGRTVVCDAGGMGDARSIARSISEFLWSRGIRDIDALLLSHGDSDHYNATPELLKRFHVHQVFVSPFMFETGSEMLDGLRASLDAAGVPVRELSGGDALFADTDARLVVLHPPQQNRPGGDNAHSLVLGIEYQRRRILLPGDIEPPGLDDLLAESPWDCDVLIAPHHGSLRSRPGDLLVWCRPEWVVLSGARGDVTPAVEDTYMRSGCQLLDTARQGAIRISIANEHIDVSPWLPERTGAIERD